MLCPPHTQSASGVMRSPHTEFEAKDGLDGESLHLTLLEDINPSLGMERLDED